MFVELCNLLEQYESWSSLCATTDLDAVVELCCSSPTLFETNFRALRDKRRAAERLPDFIKVDCICVSLGPLKLSLEDNFQRAYETLLLVLKRTMTNDINEVTHLITDFAPLYITNRSKHT